MLMIDDACGASKDPFTGGNVKRKIQRGGTDPFHPSPSDSGGYSVTQYTKTMAEEPKTTIILNLPNARHDCTSNEYNTVRTVLLLIM